MIWPSIVTLQSIPTAACRNLNPYPLQTVLMTSLFGGFPFGLRHLEFGMRHQEMPDNALECLTMRSDRGGINCWNDDTSRSLSSRVTAIPSHNTDYRGSNFFGHINGVDQIRADILF